MAACGAMRLKYGVPAVALAVLLLAGCSRLVDGHAVIAVPRPGSPVQWVPCAAAPSDESRIPAGAECGMLSVPVDYAQRDGEVAQIAMIRFKATGAKIGSLVINPGGPGESGVQAAAALVPTLPASIRERFDLVGFDPRGVASSTPAVWCNSDADNDRLRADPQVDYSPAGVAHIEKETKDFVQRCVDKMGKEFLANVGTADVVKDLDAMRAALGDDEADLPGLFVRHPDRGVLRRSVPAECAGDGPRRRRRPQCRPDRGRHPPGRRVPEGVQRLRRRLRNRSDLPAGHRPGQGRRRLSQHGRPARGEAGQDQGSARSELQRRPRRDHPAAVLAKPVAAPHVRADRTQGRHRRHLAGAGRHVHGPRRRRPLQQLDRRAGGGQLRGPARRDRPRQDRRGGPTHP